MAPNGDDRKKASDLQKALETLLALEKLGALPTLAADEVRNIIAEGIADKFGDNYRKFPCAREGIEIRRDAVPKPCVLRKSAQEFVAAARSPEKTTNTKGQEGQKQLVAKATTAKERATFSALAQVNKPQRNLGPTVGHAARNEKAKPRKTPSPVKQQPETSPNPSDPTKEGTTKGWQQTVLKSGEQAWSVYLAQKAAESKTPARSGNQQKLKAQGTGSPIAPATQSAAVGPHKDGQAAAATATATRKNGADAPNEGMPSQPLETAAGTSDEAPAPLSTTGESANPKPPSSGKASSDSDLIDFDC